MPRKKWVVLSISGVGRGYDVRRASHLAPPWAVIPVAPGNEQLVFIKLLTFFNSSFYLEYRKIHLVGGFPFSVKPFILAEECFKFLNRSKFLISSFFSLASNSNK